MVNLIDMAEGDYPEYRQFFILEYAQDLQSSRGYDEEKARAIATQSIDTLLPLGVYTEANKLWCIVRLRLSRVLKTPVDWYGGSFCCRSLARAGKFIIIRLSAVGMMVDAGKRVFLDAGIYSAERPVPVCASIGSHNVYYVKSPVVVNKFISHIHVTINQYVSNF
ncbi:hypothetical protein [Pectobacterium fontis]|uniref:hypothetical protein n=1 Tax=Pectobacterium fontis TaxID=2558042 RepID=UPI001F2CB4C6|nr:hypothetical protein [Pectobacterium fontis]